MSRPPRRRNPLAAVLGKYAVDATVTAAERVTPATLRIRLGTDRPLPFTYRPGQHIRVQLKDPLSVSGLLHPAQTLRSYTIWDLDEDRDALELRIHMHRGDGIGLRWAREATPGDRVTFWWQQSGLHTLDAPAHVFIGDETAAAAFGPMIRALAATHQVLGVLESERAEHDLPLPGDPPLIRVHRHGAPAAASRILLAAVRRLEPPPAAAVYVAGEAGTCQLVHRHLVHDRNWPRTSMTVKPFWSPGKHGLH